MIQIKQKKSITSNRKPLRKIVNTDDSEQVPINFKGGLLKNLPTEGSSILAR